MFSKTQIDEWIHLAETGINKPADDAYNDTTLRMKFLEAKVLTDRWGNVTTDFIIHSSHKEKFRKALEGAVRISNEPTVEEAPSIKSLLERLKEYIMGDGYPIKTSSDDNDSLWGSNVIYSDNIPVDKGLAVVLENGALVPYLAFECDDESDTERSVAVFPM